MKPDKTSPKTEAIKALEQAREALLGPPLPLPWSIVGGLVSYALAQLGQVEELKRRRAKKELGPALKPREAWI